jgi:plastocyanin
MRRAFAATTAVVFAFGLAGGQIATAGGGKTVKALSLDFSPKRVTIQDGQKVTWKYIEGSAHTVTMKKGPFSKVLDASNPTVSKRFKKEGTFRYICIPHADFGMRGKVIVE